MIMPVEQIPAGYVENSSGNLVQESKVKEQDKLRDQVTLALAKEAELISEQLKTFKTKALRDIADLIQIAADKYEINMGGKKGNVSISSYNGQYKVQRTYADNIAFTEEIEAAKALFDQCLMNWSEGGSDNVQKMKAVIDRTFRTNRNGQIKTAQVVDLMRTEIDDDLWMKAIEALTESMQVTGSTVYVRVYKRIGESDRYQAISLDLASV
jgi:hypothetical protein